MLYIPQYLSPDLTGSPFDDSPDAETRKASGGALPQGFYTTTAFPGYIKLGGAWRLLPDCRMDACVVLRDGEPVVTDPRDVRDGDDVVVGRSDDGTRGLYVRTGAFRFETADPDDSEAFRSGFYRETSQTRDYEQLYDVLRYDRDHGFILWAVGAACAFDYDARKAMANLIKAGYCDAFISGNALALYDLEAAMFNTCCGQDIYTKRYTKNGHYNQMDVLQRVRARGGVRELVRGDNLRDGIMAAVAREEIPFLLTGSTRDDGPLPDVVTDSVEAKRRLRAFAKQATTVVCLASQSLCAAVSRLTPTYQPAGGTLRPVFFFDVDISEYPISKLRDRGTGGFNGIVTNIQDCLVNLERNLI